MSEIEKQFEAIANEYIQVEDDKTMSAYELNINWPSLKTLMPAPPKKVLDYGAGGGTYSRIMADMGYEVLAVDNAATMVGESKAKGINSQEWTYTDAPLEKSFDIIFAKLVLQFVADLDMFAEVMRTHLNEGGILIISIPHPDRSRPQLKPGNNVYKTQVGQSGLFVDMIHREKEDVVQIFELHGLKLISSQEPTDPSNNEPPKRLNLVFEKAR